MARRRTVVVGDSLGVGTVPFLQQQLGGPVRADVRVGRSSSDGVNALSRLLRGGADRIVLDLGMNDGSAQQLRQSVQRARSLAGNRPIYIPTVNGPGAAQKNAVLRQLAGGNVHLVNWAGQSHGLVGGDGIHATGAGYRRRAQILHRAMSSGPEGAQSSGNGSGGSVMALGGMGMFGRRFVDPEQADMLTAAIAGNKAQPTGSLADLPESVSNRVRLGQGLATHSLGGAQVQSPFTRSVVNRHGKLFEAHDYGNGTVKYFQRKNPAILEAASKMAAARQLGQPAPAAPTGLDPAGEELLRMLLGNPTMRR